MRRVKQSPGPGAMACPYCGRTDDGCSHRLAWRTCDREVASDWDGESLPERAAQDGDDGYEAIYVAQAIEDIQGDVAAALVRWHSLGADGTLPLEGLSGAMCSLWSDTASEIRECLDELLPVSRTPC